MKIVIPMAGRGARFADRGVQTPKPLINVAGYPMMFWAYKSLIGLIYSEIIFIAQRQHEDEFHVSKLIDSFNIENWRLVLLDGVTEGQLCTVLTAREYIDSEEAVLIASADTYVVSDLAKDIRNMPQDYHGIISVADMPGERWSFARANAAGWVDEVAEKVRISNNASTGLYFFSSGRELLLVADDIISRKRKTRGEYYVIPVYQEYIKLGMKVGLSYAKEMWDMGTPEAKANFEEYLRQM